MRRILVSRCLIDFPYRYDGKDTREKEIVDLKNYYEVIPVCPEVELLNLSVPRPKLKFVPYKEKIKLLRETDGKDFTEELRKKSEEFLKNLGKVDCAILKSKSPSCGIGDAKIYKCLNCEEELGRRDGIFTEVFKKLFPGVPIISEKDLKAHLL